MRTALKPAAFTASISCWVTAGLPKAVSLPVASSEFPRFQPTVIFAATSVAGGSVCAPAAAGTINAPTQSKIAHFSDESALIATSKERMGKRAADQVDWSVRTRGATRVYRQNERDSHRKFGARCRAWAYIAHQRRQSSPSPA